MTEAVDDGNKNRGILLIFQCIREHRVGLLTEHRIASGSKLATPRPQRSPGSHFGAMRGSPPKRPRLVITDERLRKERFNL